MPATILVSGAANGLGAAFVKAYRELGGTKIIAIDKYPITSVEHDGTLTFSVDISIESSIHEFVAQIKDETIDLFVHSVGIRGLVPSSEAVNPDNVAASETLEVMDVATLSNAFSVNAAGSFLLIRALLPNLLRSQQPKVIVMSSRMGSIGTNSASGGSNTAAGSAYAYRASKAALNAIVRSLAVDLPEVTFVLCHPGRVATKLVRGREAGAIEPEQAVQDILPLIQRWSHAESGQFYDRFGKPIPW